MSENRMSPKERIFAKHGCHGFWVDTYATLPASTLIRLLQAKNDRRLVGVIGTLKRLTTETDRKTRSDIDGSKA